MKDCSNHKKDVAGISDMKVLSEMIGDLHYETLYNFLECLYDKLIMDAAKDLVNGRRKLSDSLELAASNILFASIEIEQAWIISKQFMNKK